MHFYLLAYWLTNDYLVTYYIYKVMPSANFSQKDTQKVTQFLSGDILYCDLRKKLTRKGKK